MPTISVQGKLKQKDLKFKVSLGYMKNTQGLRIARGGDGQRWNGEERSRVRKRESIFNSNNDN